MAHYFNRFDNEADREADAIRRLPTPRIKPYFRQGKAYSRRFDEHKAVRPKITKPTKPTKAVDFNWTPFS